MRALLAERYQEGQDPAADKQRHAVIKELIGDGWDINHEEEKFKYARKQMIGCIKSLCGNDFLKQQQLSEALYLRYAR